MSLSRSDNLISTSGRTCSSSPASTATRSASSYAEDVEKAYDAGASGYVTKDRIAQDLVRTVLDAVT